MLHSVRDALLPAGYVPLLTGDPRELQDLLRTHRPHLLVLLDLRLPGADGIELLQSVPELADLPVIFLSGYGREEMVARALELGAVDYIAKPFLADRADGAGAGGVPPAGGPGSLPAGRAGRSATSSAGCGWRAGCGDADGDGVRAPPPAPRSTPDAC